MDVLLVIPVPRWREPVDSVDILVLMSLDGLRRVRRRGDAPVRNRGVSRGVGPTGRGGVEHTDGAFTLTVHGFEGEVAPVEPGPTGHENRFTGNGVARHRG